MVSSHISSLGGKSRSSKFDGKPGELRPAQLQGGSVFHRVGAATEKEYCWLLWNNLFPPKLAFLSQPSRSLGRRLKTVDPIAPEQVLNPLGSQSNRQISLLCESKGFLSRSSKQGYGKMTEPSDRLKLTLRFMPRLSKWQSNCFLPLPLPLPLPHTQKSYFKSFVIKDLLKWKGKLLWHVW